MGKLTGVLIWHYENDVWKDIRLVENADRLEGYRTSRFVMIRDKTMYIHIQYDCIDRGEYIALLSQPAIVKVVVEYYDAYKNSRLFYKEWSLLYAPDGGTRMWLWIPDPVPTNVSADNIYIIITTYEGTLKTGSVIIPTTVISPGSVPHKTLYGGVEIGAILVNPLLTDEQIAYNLTSAINNELYKHRAELENAMYWLENAKVNRINPTYVVYTADIYYASPAVPLAVLLSIIFGVSSFIISAWLIITYIRLWDTEKRLVDTVRSLEEVEGDVRKIREAVDNAYINGKIDSDTYGIIVDQIDGVHNKLQNIKSKAQYSDSEWVNKFIESSITQIITIFIPLMVIFMFLSLLMSFIRGD